MICWSMNREFNISDWTDISEQAEAIKKDGDITSRFINMSLEASTYLIDVTFLKCDELILMRRND